MITQKVKYITYEEEEVEFENIFNLRSEKKKNSARIIEFNIVPNQKQELFFTEYSRHLAYGGARAGGKSWAMRWKFILLALKHKGLKLLLLRRTYPELRENHLLPMLVDLEGLAKYKSDEKVFVFPNGSRIKLGYCDAETDVLQYQGQEYDVIGFEEATTFTEFQLKFVSTACRSTRTDFKTRIYYTCNPGGVGHAYIKRLFIDKEYEPGENANEYKFIPALIYDNEVLMKNNPEYINILNNLPEDLRKAHRDGDWDALAGQFFKEFKKQIHVLEPFLIPKEWKRFVTIDYGLDMLAAYWIAIDFHGTCYVYREIHLPDLIISDAAKKLLDATGDETIIDWYVPPDLGNRRQDTGKSAIQIFAECGIICTISKNDRINGWLCVKECLKVIERKNEYTGELEKTTKFYIFSNCKWLLKHLPIAQRDDKNPNDMATEPHIITHACDAIRYFCITWISAPEIAKLEISGHYARKELLMNGYTNTEINKLEKAGKVKIIM